jgi:hypothetical protein
MAMRTTSTTKKRKSGRLLEGVTQMATGIRAPTAVDYTSESIVLSTARLSPKQQCSFFRLVRRNAFAGWTLGSASRRPDGYLIASTMLPPTAPTLPCPSFQQRAFMVPCRVGDFWIACDFCDTWYDGKCVQASSTSALWQFVFSSVWPPSPLFL